MGIQMRSHIGRFCEYPLPSGMLMKVFLNRLFPLLLTAVWKTEVMLQSQGAIGGHEVIWMVRVMEPQITGGQGP